MSTFSRLAGAALLLMTHIPQSVITTLRPGQNKDYPVSLSHTVPVPIVPDDSTDPGIHETEATSLIDRGIAYLHDAEAQAAAIETLANDIKPILGIVPGGDKLSALIDRGEAVITRLESFADALVTPITAMEPLVGELTAAPSEPHPDIIAKLEDILKALGTLTASPAPVPAKAEKVKASEATTVPATPTA